MEDKLFNQLMESVKQMKKIQKGILKPSRRFSVGKTEIQEIREKTGLSQGEFSDLIGISVRTLQNWEQGHRQPKGPARALLLVVKMDPKAVVKSLLREKNRKDRVA